MIKKLPAAAGSFFVGIRQARGGVPKEKQNNSH